VVAAADVDLAQRPDVGGPCRVRLRRGGLRGPLGVRELGQGRAHLRLPSAGAAAVRGQFGAGERGRRMQPQPFAGDFEPSLPEWRLWGRGRVLNEYGTGFVDGGAKRRVGGGGQPDEPPLEPAVG
jgi:hypothetical protein